MFPGWWFDRPPRPHKTSNFDTSVVNLLFPFDAAISIPAGMDCPTQPVSSTADIDGAAGDTDRSSPKSVCGINPAGWLWLNEPVKRLSKSHTDGWAHVRATSDFRVASNSRSWATLAAMLGAAGCMVRLHREGRWLGRLAPASAPSSVVCPVSSWSWFWRAWVATGWVGEIIFLLLCLLSCLVYFVCGFDVVSEEFCEVFVEGRFQDFNILVPAE